MKIVHVQIRALAHGPQCKFQLQMITVELT
jgi:hypothetical protein